jgi:hypothetical protein
MQGLYPLNWLQESRSQSCQLVFSQVQVLNVTKNWVASILLMLFWSKSNLVKFGSKGLKWEQVRTFSWLWLISSFITLSLIYLLVDFILHCLSARATSHLGRRWLQWQRVDLLISKNNCSIFLDLFLLVPWASSRPFSGTFEWNFV